MMNNWKKVPVQQEQRRIEYTSLASSRKFFAIDDSGSTAGSILRLERQFVETLANKYSRPENKFSLWGSTCDVPTAHHNSLRWNSVHGGTDPAQILRNQDAQTTIMKSDMWFLITDGDIWDKYVHELAELGQQSGVGVVPIVFLIVGSCGKSPEKTNISVGIPFYANCQDATILFKDLDTKRIYAIAGKGCFAELGGSEAAQDLSSWSNMPVFKDEFEFLKYCDKVKIQFPKAEFRNVYAGSISLGEEWERSQGGPVLVDLELLPKAGVLSDKDVIDILAEDAFNALALAYKTRQRIPELRSFVQAQKVELLIPKLKDVAGAASIIAKMADSNLPSGDRTALQEQLREAHNQNRKHYQNTVTQLTDSPEAQAAKKRNLQVDAAMRALASMEAASFSAEILSRKSNRARRAEIVSTNTELARANLDLDGPSCRGFCLVCCGEDEVMSICLKNLDADNMEDNTTDFALNFPLAVGVAAKNVNLVSSQNVCFQCALWSPDGISIFKEKLKAIIPAVSYTGSNKHYINQQLYLGLTAGLATGAAGVSQLFMAILEQVLKTKPWAGARLEEESQTPSDEQNEAVQRRQTFQWMLDQLIENTFTRENFTETGDWVKYPEALKWVAKDFETNSLASFAVTYPAAGFPTLLGFGEKTGAFAGHLLRQLKAAKGLYSITAKYLSDLQIAPQNPEAGKWQQKYLETIYQEFNAPLVPRDLGREALVTDIEVFKTRLAKIVNMGQGKARGNQKPASDEERKAFMRKVQLLLFWLVNKQRWHCTAQTFFKETLNREHLASAVFNFEVEVPEAECQTVLMSIFAKHNAEFIDRDAAAVHDTTIPFSNPFGASVIRCGVAECSASFLPTGLAANKIKTTRVKHSEWDAVRAARAKHLIQVFGIRERFERSSTGLPERVGSGGSPPTSAHTNVHISIVREWAAQSRAARRAICDNQQGERDKFVKRVRERLCEGGRGNIYDGRLDEEIVDILPSFFAVLRQALRLERRADADAETDTKADVDIAEYEHDFDQNSIEAKVRYELGARGQ